MERTGEGSTVSLTEALENYAAHHPESIDELLQWSARKFEHFYVRFQKRQVIEGLERQKNDMVAALWSNSTWDDKKGTRATAIEQIEEQYAEATRKIKASGTQKQDEEEIDPNNPFFAASERGVAKVEQRMGYAPTDDDSEKETKEVDYMNGLDQE